MPFTPQKPTPIPLDKVAEIGIGQITLVYYEVESQIQALLRYHEQRGNEGSPFHLKAVQQELKKWEKKLYHASEGFAKETIPACYKFGFEEVDKAIKKAGETPIGTSFSKLHEEAMLLLADNVNKRFSDAIVTIGRQVDDVFRAVALDATTSSIAGINTWRNVAKRQQATLGRVGVTAFRDISGREWNMGAYCRMVARTTTMEAHYLGTANRLLENGYDLVQIARHGGECEKCAGTLNALGVIYSISGASKQYPPLERARSAGLFHPQCRHALSAYIVLDESEPEAVEKGRFKKAYTEDELKGMKLPDLRRVAKELGLSHTSVTFLNKDLLLQAILDPSKERELIAQLRAIRAQAKEKARPNLLTPTIEDILHDVTKLPKDGKWHSFQSDTNKIEAQQIQLRWIKDVDGRESIQVNLKVMFSEVERISKNLRDVMSAQQVHYGFNKGSIKDGYFVLSSELRQSSGRALIAKGKDNGSMILFGNDPETRAICGLLDVRIRDVTMFNQTFAEIFDDLLGIPQAMTAPSASDVRLFKLMRAVWQFAPEKEIRFRSGEWDRTPANLERALRDAGIDLAVIDRMELKEVFPGYWTYVVPDIHKTYAKDVKTIFSGGYEASTLVTIAKQGTGAMSTTERFRSGIIKTGASSDSDIQTGGADSIFCRICPVGNRSSYGNYPFASSFKIVLDPRVLDRTDWYAYHGDRYGTVDPGAMGGRDAPSRFFERERSDHSRGNEIMFRRGVPIDMIQFVDCGEESMRRDLIAQLHAEGIRFINGKAVEEWVRVKTGP